MPVDVKVIRIYCDLYADTWNNTNVKYYRAGGSSYFCSKSFYKLYIFLTIILRNNKYFKKIINTLNRSYLDDENQVPSGIISIYKMQKEML